MGDYEERTTFGDIYVELSAGSAESAQIRLGHSEAGHLFDTQACNSEGVFEADVQTSEIAIGVSGAKRVLDFAASLRWLAGKLDTYAQT